MVICVCVYVTQFGEIPLLTRVADRPLLSSGRSATLTDLCSFFVTVTATVTDSSSPVPPTGHTAATRLTPAVSQSHTLSRARSAPNVSLADSHSSPVWASELKDNSHMSSMEYIEKLILADFLEPMPQN